MDDFDITKIVAHKPKKSEPSFSITTVITIIAALCSIFATWGIQNNRITVIEGHLTSQISITSEVKIRHEQTVIRLEAKHDREVLHLRQQVQALEVENAKLSVKITP